MSEPSSNAGLKAPPSLSKGVDLGRRLSLPRVLLETAKRWLSSDAPTRSAALAFYTLFSMAPVLVVVLAVAGTVFGEAVTRTEIEGQIRGLMGSETARTLMQVLESADRPELVGWAGVTGFVALLLGATAVFTQLQEALNSIWGVKPKISNLFGAFVVKRLLSFGLVLSIGFLLLVSLVLSAGVSAVSAYAQSRWASTSVLFSALDFALSIALVTLLFAVIYRVLPDARIAWRDVWLGAFVTALLFSLGKGLIGTYLGRSSIASVYGVAGSMVLSLLWIYYSSMLLLAGAGFTRVWSQRHRPLGVLPEEGAEHALPEPTT